MSELNETQMQILRFLLFSPSSRFREVNINKLSTDQFSYHLKCLQDLKLIKKENLKYTLTSKGKEFANTMDTSLAKIEKQPKVSVFLIPARINKNGKELLIQTRLKEPYYGYKGFMTGKVRYGETILEAAKRELIEETSLQGKFRYVFTLHDMVYSKEKDLLEDKLFFIVEVTEPKGELTNAEGTSNAWITEKEFFITTPKYYNEDQIYDWYKNGNSSFKEEKYYIDKF